MGTRRARLDFNRIDGVVVDPDRALITVAPANDAAWEQALDPYLRILRAARRRGARTAAVSAHGRCSQLLRTAHLRGLFDVLVDRFDADDLRVPTAPDPSLLLEATRRMGVSPTRTAIIEDVPDGVEAGWRASFGLVLAVDRDGTQAAEFTRHGADLVVPDLAVLALNGD